ncbi:MAG: aldo/keto reductase [Spirochaetes bacterium]|nr:aldo/keto reductase [Spirochaetota bacterium]
MRETVALGDTGLSVPRLAVGTGTRGWAGTSEQTRKGIAWLSGLLEQAVSLGAGFWDLADEYGSHCAAALALRNVDRSSVVIATKTTAKDHASCSSAVDRFLGELRTSWLDIVLLHAVSSAGWNRSRRGAMAALDEAKRAGKVRAVGVSVHSLAALRTAVAEAWVDVILVRLNHAGTNMDGPLEKVLPLVRRAHAAGKGICAMKVLGCGRLASDPGRAIRFVLETGCVHALTIGPTHDQHLPQLVDIIAKLPNQDRR